MARPSGIPTRSAAANPIANSCALTAMCGQIEPFVVSSIATRRIDDGWLIRLSL